MEYMNIKSRKFTFAIAVQISVTGSSNSFSPIVHPSQNWGCRRSSRGLCKCSRASLSFSILIKWELWACSLELNSRYGCGCGRTLSQNTVVAAATTALAQPNRAFVVNELLIHLHPWAPFAPSFFPFNLSLFQGRKSVLFLHFNLCCSISLSMHIFNTKRVLRDLTSPGRLTSYTICTVLA